jgi:hypothetical protein
MQIVPAELPAQALLLAHTAPADYRDCFAVDIPVRVDLPTLVGAFYTTWLFKLERVLLGLAGHPSSDEQAYALARSQTEAFAFWKLTARQHDQLVLWDRSGATCSLLMAAPQPGGTRLYFGSGVRARARQADGSTKMPPGYRALLGLHVLYSRALLAAAARKLLRQVPA